MSVSEDTAVAGQLLGYAGYYYDRETKLYYLQARYYDPETARFLSRDPYPGDLDNPITQNGHTYANNNPVIYVDPDGELPWVVKEIAKFAIKQAVRNPKNLRIVVEKIRSFTRQKYIKKALDQLGLEVQSNLKGGYILKIMANRKRILSIDYHGLNIFKGTGSIKVSTLDISLYCICI
ncbi:RHS repeat-associated core domain protein [Anoxybacillus sp. B7M1]|uniref:RHS repeat-associated core domain-containing protein n=1 Tax=unclassified Anoxybacillus TaxID=2639704 RepID=UPI0006964BFB|nr:MULTISPECIES: RHS repeat-associated core domain-containing protein [unclassified Anoxybacillus]ANB57265.1 RHS repeat-associated core domain protein [Anoxybacillus sp. B2M1]ANB63407.1 RHS repeat-associated core domain protein [Anoxybacillus sp. B7M1]